MNDANNTKGNRSIQSNIGAIGMILIFAVIVQILSGILIALEYDPLAAFKSVRAMYFRHLYGKIILESHSAGASVIFALIYAHTIQKIFKKRYLRASASWVWGATALIFFLVTAFIGQTIRMSQRGYWGLVIIRNMLAPLPFVGPLIGDPNIAPEAVNTSILFWCHAMMPVGIVLIIMIHVCAIFYGPIKTKVFAAYTKYYVNYPDKQRALFAVCAFILVAPALFRIFLDSSNDYLEANATVTPSTMNPMWYFRPMYAVLTIINDPTLALGVIVMMLCSLLLIPALSLRPASSAIYGDNHTFDVLSILWVVSIIVLSIVGTLHERTTTTLLAGKACLVYYFCYFAWAARLASVRCVVANTKQNVDNK